MYALFAGAVFAVAAVWGFIDGNDVVELIVADTTNNITHAILAGLGLIVGMLPASAQRPAEQDAAVTTESRFGRTPAERHERTGAGRM